MQGLAHLLLQRQDPTAGLGLEVDAYGNAEAYSGIPGIESRSGLAQLQRLLRTRRSHPEAVIGSHESIAKERLGALTGDSWTWRRYVAQELLPFCGNFVTLKRLVVMLAGALDEGRQGSLLQQHAYLTQALAVAEGAAKDPNHDLGWGWPMLGLPDPGERPIAHWAPVESSAVAAFHKEQMTLAEARRRHHVGNGKEGDAGAASSSSADGAAVSVKELVKKEIAAAARRDTAPSPAVSRRDNPPPPKKGGAPAPAKDER